MNAQKKISKTSFFLKHLTIIFIIFIAIFYIRPNARKISLPLPDEIKYQSYIYYNAYLKDIGVELFRYNLETDIVDFFDFYKGFSSSSPSDFIVDLNYGLFFTARVNKKNREIFQVVGTNGSPVSLNQKFNIKTVTPEFLVVSKNALFFKDLTSVGYEIVYLNLETGEKKVLDIYPGKLSSQPRQFTLYGDKILFMAIVEKSWELFVLNIHDLSWRKAVPEEEMSCKILTIKGSKGIDRVFCFFYVIDPFKYEISKLTYFYNKTTIEIKDKDIKYVHYFKRNLVLQDLYTAKNVDLSSNVLESSGVKQNKMVAIGFFEVDLLSSKLDGIMNLDKWEDGVEIPISLDRKKRELLSDEQLKLMAKMQKQRLKEKKEKNLKILQSSSIAPASVASHRSKSVNKAEKSSSNMKKPTVVEKTLTDDFEKYKKYLFQRNEDTVLSPNWKKIEFYDFDNEYEEDYVFL